MLRLKSLRHLKSSLKLFAKSRKLLLQIRNFHLKSFYLIHELRDPVARARIVCHFHARQRDRQRHFDISIEQVRVPRFFCTRLPWKDLNEGRLALHQALQRGLHDAQVVEFMHAVGAAAQFTRSLRSTQQQLGQDGNFMPRKVVGFLQAVLICW